MPTVTCYLGANGLYNNSVQMWYLHAIEDGALWLDSIVLTFITCPSVISQCRFVGIIGGFDTKLFK